LLILSDYRKNYYIKQRAELREMTVTIKLNGMSLVHPTVHDLKVGGISPSRAIWRSLQEHLVDQFRNALGDRLIKPPLIKGGGMGSYATLPDLASKGCESWYIEITCATRIGDVIEELQIVSEGIDVIPIDYGYGVLRKLDVKTTHLKRQINHRVRINHLRIKGSVFQEILDSLKECGDLNQPLIPNFSPAPLIEGYRVVAYDHMITGLRYFCSCAQSVHKNMLRQAIGLAPNYEPQSWPHILITLLENAIYKDDICHLCISRGQSPDEAVRRYGTNIETASCFESFIDQMEFDLGIDKKTARSEILYILKLSKWVRESTLYGVIREIFPEQRVLREASPEWLGRMRIDIYLPDLHLAIEHQGEQHYRPISVFGGEETFLRVLERDALKRKLCQEHGVTVIDVRYDFPITKASLRQRLRRFL